MGRRFLERGEFLACLGRALFERFSRDDLRRPARQLASSCAVRAGPRLSHELEQLMEAAAERRMAQRRHGVGRRTHGDRRQKAAAQSRSGWKPRLEERRAHQRRLCPDRRAD